MGSVVEDHYGLGAVSLARVELWEVYAHEVFPVRKGLVALLLGEHVVVTLASGVFIYVHYPVLGN